MSLRARLIAVALLVIVAVVAAVQIAWHVTQDRWVEESVPQFERTLQEEVLQHAYAADVVLDGVKTVQRILHIGPSRFRKYFRDVLFTNGRSPEARGSVDLNPLGALHRDPHSFPLEEIRDGIRSAMETRKTVLAADGFCIAIEAGGDVRGGAWFEPRTRPSPRLPLSAYVVPILIGALLFGFVAYAFIERGVVRPIRELGAAAQSVGAGEPGVRVPKIGGARELDQLAETFNAMAAQVEGHREELEREVRRATETAERRQAALLRSARLASMGTLAAGIAHEINNPIGGMINAIHRIGQSENLSERDRRYVELIREGLERVGRIARRVLDFTPRQIEPVPFALVDVIESARALAEHRFTQQEVELQVDLEPGLPPLVGDAHEFQQVLLNVFINSLDVLEGRPAPRWIRVEARRLPDEGQIEIRITDNGPGMRADDLALVMDPFFSGKGRPDASGLGMFISHQIIENHGGSLEVDSAEGAGFTVTIRVPTADTDRAPA